MPASPWRGAFAGNRSWPNASVIRSARIPDYARRIDDHEWGSHQTGGQRGEIQDPYSLRCTPQILGAVQGRNGTSREVVTRSNASTDNH